MMGELELQQPGHHEEKVISGGQRFSENDLEGPTFNSKRLPEQLTRVPWLLLLNLIFFVLLVTTLIQVSRIHTSLQDEIQDHKEKPSLVAIPCEKIDSGLEQIEQQLTQINTSLAVLCRPCPWGWEIFQGNCYLFSRTLGSWEASHSSCRDLGAQLVIINSIEEQRFLQYWDIRKNQLTWIGLSDHKREGSWQWVDNTPLQLSFWQEGNPDNRGDEDCVELVEEKWNDKACMAQNFWVCEKPSARCPGL